MPSSRPAATRSRSSSPVEPEDSDVFLPARHRHEVRYEAQEEDLDEEDVYSDDDIEGEVRKAQDRLKGLREEQEAILRRKMELEELNSRQAEFHEGRQDVIDRIVRTSSRLEKLASDAERRGEAMRYAVDTFRQHLHILETLRPEEWSRGELSQELERALELIRAANQDYDREMRRLEGYTEESASRSGRLSGHLALFGGWVLKGFAYTLPLIILGIVALVLFLSRMDVSL